MHVLLEAVVGSQAYGLAAVDSDEDRLGLYIEPTSKWLGLHPPTDKSMTKASHDPDVVHHEVAKFCRLVLAANPTVTELLYLDEYTVRSAYGQQLVDMRSSFLSAQPIRNAYLGYCTQQFRRLENKGKYPDVPLNRIEKHSRHLLRLAQQFRQLWLTGTMQVRVPNPEEVHEFGRRVAAGDLERARTVMSDMEATAQRYPTVLPDSPDERPIESWLQNARRAFWDVKNGGLRELSG